MKIGNREVLGCGSIVTNNGDDRLEIEQSGLIFILIFESGEGEPKISGAGDGAKLTLTFTNFDNPLGLSWSGEVGKVSETKLFLALYVATLGEKPSQSRLVSFTFSKGEA